MDERILTRPRLPNPAQDSAWPALREQVPIGLRAVGAPTPIGLSGPAAATFVLAGLQLGWVDAGQDLLEQVKEVATEPGVRARL